MLMVPSLQDLKKYEFLMFEVASAKAGLGGSQADGNTQQVSWLPNLWARPNDDERTLLSAGARSLRKDVAKVREHHSSCLKWLPLALLGVSQDERQHWPQASQVPANPIQWALVGYPRTLGC